VAGGRPDAGSGQARPDALEALQPTTLRSLLDGRRAPVKAVLMDQTRLAGLGNIYADEALFLAGVLPRRAAGGLTADEVERLHRAIGEVLREAMDTAAAAFGTTWTARGKRGCTSCTSRCTGARASPATSAGLPSSASSWRAEQPFLPALSTVRYRGGDVAAGL